MSALVLMLTMVFLQEDPLQQARSLRAEGQAEQAEVLLLEWPARESQAAQAGALLAELALQLGDLPQRMALHQARLNLASQRATSLFALACLSRHQGNNPAFLHFSTTFLSEYPQADALHRLRLTALLAQNCPGWNFPLAQASMEHKFFQLCREHAWPPPQEWLPAQLNAHLVLGKPGLPVPEWLKGPEAGGSSLLLIRRQLLKGDLDQAVSLFNGLDRKEAALDRPFHILYLCLAAELQRANGQIDAAERSQAILQKVLLRTALPWPSGAIASAKEAVREPVGEPIGKPMVLDSARATTRQSGGVSITAPVTKGRGAGSADQTPASDRLQDPEPLIEKGETEAAKPQKPLLDSELGILQALEVVNRQQGDRQTEAWNPKPSQEESGLLRRITAVNEMPLSRPEDGRVASEMPVSPLQAGAWSPLWLFSAATEARLASSPWARAEKILLSGNATVQDLAGLQPQSPYQRVYFDYLQGLLHLRAGRLSSAFQALSNAEQAIAQMPFSLLEVKILMALGDYYQRERNPEQAEWYHIAATQLLLAPEMMPELEGAEAAVLPSPFASLIDAALVQSERKDRLPRLNFFAEQEQWVRDRQLAYRHAILSTNNVLNNQLLQLGGTLAEQLQECAESANGVLPQKRFEQISELFLQLTTKAQAFFLKPQVHPVATLQEALPEGGRILRFVEGQKMLGLLLISRSQALVLPLGLRSELLSYSAAARASWLRDRLGPATQGATQLWICASPTLRDPATMLALQEALHEVRAKAWLLSTHGLVPGLPSACEGTLVVSETTSASFYALVQSLPRAGLDWFSAQGASPANFLTWLRSKSHLVLQGGLVKEGEQWAYPLMGRAVPLRDWAMENPSLCSLTLVVEASPTLLEAWPQLNLLRAGGTLRIHILPENAAVGNQENRPGLILP